MKPALKRSSVINMVFRWWKRRTQKRDETEHEALLRASLQGRPDALALCQISANPHGYDCRSELWQMRDGRFLSRAVGPFDDQNKQLIEVQRKLDLRDELQRLKAEHSQLRTTLPQDMSRGRFVLLELAVEGDVQWIRFSGPLIGSPIRDNSLDRLYRTVCGWP